MPANQDLVTLIRQLESVGMAHEDVARFAYEHALEELAGQYPKDAYIPASVRLRAASDMVEAFDRIELERRNVSWLWKNLNQHCSKAPDGLYRYTAFSGMIDTESIKMLIRWRDKGWITFEYKDGSYCVAIVKEEAANVS